MKSRKSLIPLCAFFLLMHSACSKKDHTEAAASTLPSLVDPGTEPAAASARVAVSIKVEAENYTTMSGIQIEDCREGGKDVGYIAKGDWMNYSVNIPATGTYTMNFRVAGASGTLQVQKTDGTVLSNVTLPATAGGQIYTTASGQITLTAGTQTLRIFANSASWNLNWFEIVCAGDAIQAPTTTTYTRKNLVLESTFEDVSDFNNWSKEICRPTALQISSEVARKGKTSARFEFAMRL